MALTQVLLLLLLGGPGGGRRHAARAAVHGHGGVDGGELRGQQGVQIRLLVGRRRRLLLRVLQVGLLLGPVLRQLRLWKLLGLQGKLPHVAGPRVRSGQQVRGQRAAAGGLIWQRVVQRELGLQQARRVGGPGRARAWAPAKTLQ